MSGRGSARRPGSSSKLAARWSIEELARIEKALREYASGYPSLQAASVALGLGAHALGKVLSSGDTLTPKTADALAVALKTTVEDIAKGRKLSERAVCPDCAAEAATGIDAMFMCDGPGCKCSDGEECCCIRRHRDRLVDVCVNCDAGMRGACMQCGEFFVVAGAAA